MSDRKRIKIEVSVTRNSYGGLIGSAEHDFDAEALARMSDGQIVQIGTMLGVAMLSDAVEVYRRTEAEEIRQREEALARRAAEAAEVEDAAEGGE